MATVLLGSFTDENFTITIPTLCIYIFLINNVEKSSVKCKKQQQKQQEVIQFILKYFVFPDSSNNRHFVSTHNSASKFSWAVLLIVNPWAEAH